MSRIQRIRRAIVGTRTPPAEVRVLPVNHYAASGVLHLPLLEVSNGNFFARTAALGLVIIPLVEVMTTSQSGWSK